jgi:tRNA 2-thiocytidine biosynthesis protein TtcA
MQILVPIARPPWTSLGRKLESMTRKAIYEFSLIDSKEPIAVALSGGKDSLCLLFMLHAIRGRGCPNFNLIAIHVDGEYTCGAGVDKFYLKSICDKLEIPLIIETSKQTLEKLECYSCSRERRKLIFDAAKKMGCHKVAFGHHRDDSNQTLIMNLLHKGEFAANLPLVYMKDYDVTIIRPLIYIEEKSIIEFAKLYDFLKITCQCPVGQNSLRKESKRLIEILEKSYPNASSNLFQASQKYGSSKAQAYKENVN